MVSPKIPRPEKAHSSSPNLLFLPPNLISLCRPIFQTQGFSVPRIFFPRKNEAEYKRRVKFQGLETPDEASLTLPVSKGLFWNSDCLFYCVDQKSLFGVFVGRNFFGLASFHTLPCVGAKWLQLCLILCDPMNCSPPGSSSHRIFQARMQE